jgi:hypothetical protein
MFGLLLVHEPIRHRQRVQSIMRSSPTFEILEDHHPEARGLQLIGPRQRRRKANLGVDSLERQLAAARKRHAALEVLVSDMDRPKHKWQHTDLLKLKRKKLLEQDKIACLEALLQRNREGQSWQLGSGAEGAVLLGRSVGDGGGIVASPSRLVAIKVVPLGSDSREARSELAAEAELLAELTRRSAVGFPRLHYYGEQSLSFDGKAAASAVLCMELLGPSVEDLLWETSDGTCLSHACVLQLGREALARLQVLHAMGVVHNDCKPSNLCMGLGEHRHRVYLVDFGASSSVAPVTAVAPPAEAAAPTAAHGTPLFASRASHLGGRPTRPEDDLEGLCFTLAYLCLGNLPWGRSRGAGSPPLSDLSAVAAGEGGGEGGGGGDPLRRAKATEEIVTAKEVFLRELEAGMGVAEALPAGIGALWREARRADEKEESMSYEIDGPFATACRAALGHAQGVDEDAPCTAAYDWDASGISWAAEGEIQRSDRLAQPGREVI